MEFTKMHGIGNDYIYFNCLENELENPDKIAIKLSDRHFGIGGDGIVLILPSTKGDFKMRMFNADGSEGRMCGNASRCIGKYLYEKGITNKEEIILETLSGLKVLKLNVKNKKVLSVRVNMGEPILKGTNIPTIYNEDRVVNKEIEVEGKVYKVTCVSMGNPHCIVYEKQIDKINLENIGPGFENHTSFPNRINTEFVQVIDNKTLKMRVWERGSGETLACGTGACAIVVASVLNGYVKRGEEIKVKLLGGELSICYDNDGFVYMEGDAKFVYEGRIENE